MTTQAPPPPPDPEEIARASGSNLALALIVLPRERRGDMRVFYAFCRVIDDIADDQGRTLEERRIALGEWRCALLASTPGEPPLAVPVRALIAKRQLDPALFAEIIAGCEMDLAGVRPETWEDLRLYCHRVASVVGLISIEIFGCRDPECRRYAADLGLALQLTNILRDIGEDFANGGRIYLPRADMERFGYTAEDLAEGRRNQAFHALMQFEAERALGFYASAEAVRASLPRSDRRALVAAEIMRAVYRRLLDRMQRGKFRVFGHRTRLSRLEKLWLIARVFLRRA